MDAQDPFESPKSLIAWAREDAKEIERLSRTFFDSKPYTSVIEFDPKINKDVHKIAFTAQPSNQIRKFVHSCISNIRHALDQATFAAVSQLVPGNSGDVYFPFGMSPTDLDTRMRKKNVIPEEIRPVIRDLQPYPSGNGYTGGDNIFRALGNISGPNKHRTAIDIGHIAAGINFTVNNIVEEVQVFVDPIWDSMKNELILSHRTPGSKPNYNINPTFFIAFADFNGRKNVPVGRAIAHFILRTESFIAALEAKTVEVLAGRVV